MGKIVGFRDLDVWQLGKRIALATYEATKRFPADERFGLALQMRRASVSIASNVAEGFSRKHRAEYRQFLHIALGSCSELETQAEIARDLGYSDIDVWRELLEMVDHESRMLRSLINRL